MDIIGNFRKTIVDLLSSVIETSSRGGVSLAVTLQDQTTGVLNLPFLKLVATPTLATDTVVGESTFTLSGGHGLTAGNVGNIIELADDRNGSHFLQATITDVTADVVTIDCFVNRVYPAANTVIAVSTSEMNVNGAVTPQVFSVAPLPFQSGDITRLILQIVDENDMDFSTFGGNGLLPKGLLLRINNGDGTYRNLYNWKSNGDIINVCFDHAFQENNGQTVRGFIARLTWAGQNKHGVAIRLDGALGEQLELVVQDDLTTQTTVKVIAQGSELQGS